MKAIYEVKYLDVGLIGYSCPKWHGEMPFANIGWQRGQGGKKSGLCFGNVVFGGYWEKSCASCDNLDMPAVPMANATQK